MQIQQLKSWFDQNRSQIFSDYFTFLRFPSISADPARRGDCTACAEWLTSWLKKSGFSSELVATPGLPLVYSEDLSAGLQTKTLLIYGHYDVQPVDPLDLWKSAPFEPTEREGSIFARGAADDKGQIFYALVALRAWKELGKKFPCNVKLCIEGEEESSSEGLIKALTQAKTQTMGSLKKKLAADSLLVVDFDQFDRNIPAVSLGARGIAALEVRLEGSKMDMHSGLCGGIAYNPNRALVQLLSKLWDEEGKVAVPQFYEGILPVSEEEKKLYSYRYDKKYYEEQFGIHAFGGEKGVSLQEANWFRPTLELNGIGGGYVGAGVKTVIPSVAEARITCRLVPGQNPEKISKAVALFLQHHIPKGMKLQVIEHKGMPAFRGSIHSTLAQAIAKSATEVTGNSCRYMLTGGSIPIVPAFVETLGVDVVGMGYGLLEDQIHAPNEHFDRVRFEQGFLTVGRALSLLL